MKKLLILPLIALFVISCSNERKALKEKHDEVLQEVFDAHDVAMPKMGEINTLLKQLEEKIDSTSESENYIKAQKELQAAHKHMMTWMQDFSSKFPDVNKIENLDLEELKQRTDSLISEKPAVEAMRDHVLKSISRAKEILNN